MVPLSVGRSVCPRIPSFVAAGPANRVERLVDDVAEVELVVPSTNGRFLSVSAPPVLFLSSSASPVAPVAETSDVVSDVAFDVAPSRVAPDAATDVAPLTTSSALPPSIPSTPIFPSSPHSLSASAPRSPNTAASTVVLGVALRHLRIQLARRDARYTDLEDRFVAEEDDVDRWKAEVQSLAKHSAAFEIRTANGNNF